MLNRRKKANSRPITGAVANVNNRSSSRRSWPWTWMPALVLLAVAVPLDTASAADAKIIPKITVAAGHNDNIFLSSSNEVDSSILAVRPGVEFDYRTLLSSFSLKADLAILNYLDESDLNRTNQYYSLSADRKIKERWTTSGEFSFTRDTLLDTYLDEIGRVVDRTERDFLEAGGRVDYDLSLVSGISAAYLFQNADYDSDRYADFNRHNGGLNYFYRLKNQVDTLSIGPSYSHRSTDSSDVDALALNLGWNRKWSDITNSRARIGARYTSIERKNGTEDDQWGVRAGLDITRKGLASTTTFRYFHALRTTVEEEDVNVDNFFLNYRRSITERFGVELEGRLVFSYAFFDQDTQINDKRYYWVEPSLFYRLTRDLNLSVRYRYQNNVESIDGGDRTRERNLIWLQLNYDVALPL